MLGFGVGFFIMSMYVEYKRYKMRVYYEERDIKMKKEIQDLYIKYLR